jgi:hypothetical protein
MCQKHQRRCAALQEIREEALREWTEARTYHDIVVCWGRLGGRTTAHRYGRSHFSELARQATAWRAVR